MKFYYDFSGSTLHQKNGSLRVIRFLSKIIQCCNPWHPLPPRLGCRLVSRIQIFLTCWCQQVNHQSLQMAMEEKLASLRKQEVGALRHAMFSWSFWLVGGHLWPGLMFKKGRLWRDMSKNTCCWTSFLAPCWWPISLREGFLDWLCLQEVWDVSYYQIMHNEWMWLLKWRMCDVVWIKDIEGMNAIDDLASLLAPPRCEVIIAQARLDLPIILKVGSLGSLGP